MTQPTTPGHACNPAPPFSLTLSVTLTLLDKRDYGDEDGHCSGLLDTPNKAVLGRLLNRCGSLVR